MIKVCSVYLLYKNNFNLFLATIQKDKIQCQITTIQRQESLFQVTNQRLGSPNSISQTLVSQILAIDKDKKA